jgi:hypothetical protein
MIGADLYLQNAVDALIEPAMEHLVRAHEAIPDGAQLVKGGFLSGRARPFKTQIVDSKLYTAVEIPSGPHLFQSERAQEMMRWLSVRSGPEMTSLEKAATVPPALRERAKDFVATAGMELARALLNASDLQGLALSLYEARTPKRMGHTFALTCLLSIRVDRPTWSKGFKQGLPAEDVLRSFPLEFGYAADFSVRAVRPALPPGHEHRIQPRAAPPLWEVELPELERLICELFTRMGYHLKSVTRTRDNGLDMMAIAPPASAKEHLIVQVKGYLTNVGAPAVRELRDRIKPPRVTGAILLTTSGFSEDALKSARARPIQLINGTGLRQLLLEYGLRWGQAAT